MRRATLISVLAIAVLALAVGRSAGADPVVHATSANDNDQFVPRTVTILVGHTVHWQNDSGKHNVVADNGSFKLGGDPVSHSPTATPWKAQFTFNKVGTFQYYCSEHGDKGGIGMSGKVIVKSNDTTPPKITSLAAKPASFCTNKSTTCQKRGTKVNFTLSENATVKATVKLQGSTKAPTQAFNVALKKGARSVNYSGKDLKPGKYTLSLVATDANKNKSKAVTTTITVKKNG
jgi:plastocyanin